MERFLIVDDSKIARKFVSDVIVSLGKTVVFEAKNGQEAFDFYKSNYDNVDCVITDIEMPQMDGIEVVEKIVSIKKPKKIIVVSSMVDKKKILLAIAKGAGATLTKPILEEDLKKAIEG